MPLKTKSFKCLENDLLSETSAADTSTEVCKGYLEYYEIYSSMSLDIRNIMESMNCRELYKPMGLGKV